MTHFCWRRHQVTPLFKRFIVVQSCAPCLDHISKWWWGLWCWAFFMNWVAPEIKFEKCNSWEISAITCASGLSYSYRWLSIRIYFFFLPFSALCLMIFSEKAYVSCWRDWTAKWALKVRCSLAKKEAMHISPAHEGLSQKRRYRCWFIVEPSRKPFHANEER